MGTGLFGIGVSGIKAAQMGLLATEHNIVNADTAGYSRQAIVQATNISVNTGDGSIGQGVRVVTIKRMYDDFLTGSVNTAQTNYSQMEALHTQLAQIDNLLADPEAGLTPALQSFFSGVQQTAADPSSLPARQSMVSSAETLVTRFQMLDSRLEELSAQVDNRITNAVTMINSYATEIASLNEKIVLSQGAYGQPPNDLMDQRDQLVSELNKLVKVNATVNSDGSYNVFIGSGQQLVVGSRAMQLTAQPSSADLTRVAVGLQTAGGAQELPESLVTGGELGGLLQFRNDSLEKVRTELGTIATSLALTFNAQHALGQDLMGNIAADGGSLQADFFSITDPRVLPNSRNTGSAVVTASFLAPEAPVGPDYDGTFTTSFNPSNYQLTFSAGGNYAITRLSDNQVVATGSGTGTVTLPDDGLSIDITTVGAEGDRFTIKPFSDVIEGMQVNERISADPRLIAAAAPTRVTEGLTNSGSLTFGQGIVGVGYSAASLPQTLTASATTLDGATAAWTATYADGSSVSGSGSIPLDSAGQKLTNIEISGMSFSLAGSSAVGDTFTLERNTGAVQDGRNALLFANLQTSNTMSGGTASYQSTYSKIVADNGIQTREAEVRMDAQASVLDQAQAARDSLSGVNLDEEAANLIKYQQAYQAAAKVLSVGNTLFETLLSIAS